AGEIGTATLGRKGQPSRLRVDRSRLKAHIQNVPELVHQQRNEAQRFIGPVTHHSRSVFISATRRSGIVGCVRDALQVVDISCEIVERKQNEEKLLDDRTYEAMRRCDSGIIIVSTAEVEGRLNQTALIEIGAAMVHFSRRLVILHETGVSTPFELDDFCHCEFEGDTLTWETAI